MGAYNGFNGYNGYNGVYNGAYAGAYNGAYYNGAYPGAYAGAYAHGAYPYAGGLVAYANGAIVPAKTPEVLAAEQAHFAAHGIAAPVHAGCPYAAGYPYAPLQYAGLVAHPNGAVVPLEPACHRCPRGTFGRPCCRLREPTSHVTLEPDATKILYSNFLTVAIYFTSV